MSHLGSWGPSRILSAAERSKAQGSLGREEGGAKSSLVDSFDLLCLLEWDNAELHQRLDRNGKVASLPWEVSLAGKKSGWPEMELGVGGCSPGTQTICGNPGLREYKPQRALVGLCPPGPVWPGQLPITLWC